MNNRDLLKEAIADAKTVKETAIANAKAALEEAFTPYLKERLAAKLSEMDEEENDEVKEAKEEKKFKKIFKVDESEGLDEDEIEEDELNEDEIEEDEIEENFDLDELLRELDDMEEGKREDMTEGEDDLINDPKRPTSHGNVAEQGYEDEDADGVEDSEDGEVDLENMSEDDLKTFIEDVIADMVAAGELEGEIEGKEDEVGVEDEDEESETSEEEISLEELIAELKERKKYGGKKVDVIKNITKQLDELGVKYTLSKSKVRLFDEIIQPIGKDDNFYNKFDRIINLNNLEGVVKTKMEHGGGVEDYKKKLKESESKLNKAYSTIETIKTDLNEVNLLNAKLLYTNKIFRAKNLTESQKVKVLESFDKATNVKEAKLVFETLLNEVKERKLSVTESRIGGASKAAGIALIKKPILEINDQFARWQQLAGIKK